MSAITSDIAKRLAGLDAQDIRESTSGVLTLCHEAASFMKGLESRLDAALAEVETYKQGMQAAGVHMETFRERVFSAESRLEQRSTLLAEIVAWFDVVGQKCESDDYNMASDWPTDWLRRSREIVVDKGQTFVVTGVDRSFYGDDVEKGVPIAEPDNACPGCGAMLGHSADCQYSGV